MEEKAYTNSFAKIYDDVMKNVPYDLWYNYLRDLLEYYNRSPNEVIDIACGTGNMTFRFAENTNSKVSGVDISEDMLKIARKKARDKNIDVNFYQADLRAFSPDIKYDLAFSLFDSLNYILDYEELKLVFKNIYKLLYDDGIFIFDMNTIERLMDIKSGTILLNGDDYSCFWEDIIDKKNKIWKVKLKIYFDDNKVDYYEEVHKETSYPIDDIVRALKWAGFQEIDIFNAYTFEQGKDSDNRIYFIAAKDELKRNNTFLAKIAKKLKWKFIDTFIL